MKEFKDRVAVVTGAASGIGRGMAKCFAEAGMKVVLADIDENRLEVTTKSLKDSGAKAFAVVTDVSDPGQVDALGRRVLEEFGAVHVLCNNAGVGVSWRNSWEAPIEAWKWLVNVNLMGVVNGVHTFMPIMLEQGTEAHIVNTASLAGLIINSVNALYGVAKHAVVALSESLHAELLMRASKVKVSVLCPGPVNTDIIDSSMRNRPNWVPPPPELTQEEAVFLEGYKLWLKRGMDPEEVAGQVLEAIRQECFYVITHDFKGWIEQRMRGILDGKNPDPHLPPEDLMECLEFVAKN